MKVYKISTYITLSLTILSALAALITHYRFNSREGDFWSNVALAIFGSAFLTLITSLVGYFVERRKILEDFFCRTRIILKQLNKYQVDWPVEKKIDFFLSYAENDMIAWDSELRNMDFLFDKKRNKFHYVYYKIYKPIMDVNRSVNEHILNFQLHKDKSGKNDEKMRIYIEEIECLFINKVDCQVPKEIDKDGEPIDFMMASSWGNELVEKVFAELNGKYYELMYGKRKIKKMEKKEKQ